MTTFSKQDNCNQRTTTSSPPGSKRTSRKHSKRRIFKRSALCLSALILSFSTAGAALALIGLDPVQQILGAYGNATNDPAVGNIDQYLSTVDDYLRQGQEFYRNISQKNISGVLAQLDPVLGQLGIPSPRDLPGTLDDAPTPTTPEGMYEEQKRVTDTANSDQLWLNTDAVLGKEKNEGQARVNEMDKTSVASTQASIKAQQQSVSQSQQTVQDANLAQSASDSSEQLSQEAKGRQVSQEVLKLMAEQLLQLAKSNSAVAKQVASLSQQQALAAGQVSALAAQSQVANDHMAQMRVGQVIANTQLHDIFNAQRQANNMSAMDSQQNTQLSLESTNAIYIPGLFNADSTAN